MQSKTGYQTVKAGSTVTLTDVPVGTLVSVNPGSSGTMSVSVRISPAGSLIPWEYGAVSAATADILNASVHQVVVSATTADGIVEWRQQS